MIDVPIPELEQGIQDLKARCRTAGRNPKDVTVSMRAQVHVMPHSPSDDERFAPLVGTQEEIIRDLKRMREIGVDHVALWPAGQKHSLESYLEQLEFFSTKLIPDVVSESVQQP